MIYAFNPENPYLSFHENNYGFFDITLQSDGSCVRSQKFDKVTSAHAWLMWLSWTLISLLQLITNRYLKFWWQYHQLVHTVLGLLSGCMTLSGLLVMLKYQNWKFNMFGAQYHQTIALFCLPFLILVIIVGSSVLLLRKFNGPW